MISENQMTLFWDYLIFYPEEDEEGYDGVHDGGIKTIKEDAPPEAISAFNQFMKNQKNGVKL